MSEELIKRLRMAAKVNDEMQPFTPLVALLNEAADALSRPAPASDDALTAYTEASQSLGQRVDDPNPLAKNAPSDDAWRVVLYQVKSKGWFGKWVPCTKDEYEAASKDSGWDARALVLASDLDAAYRRLAMEEDAAKKGETARQAAGGMEMDIAELRFQLEAVTAERDALRDLLRSAHAIAARKGVDTAWDRFAASCAVLGAGPITARVYKVDGAAPEEIPHDSL